MRQEAGSKHSRMPKQRQNQSLMRQQMVPHPVKMTMKRSRISKMVGARRATEPKRVQTQLRPFRRGLVLLTVGVGLAACDDLTRFEQERYECNLNRQGLVEVDMRSTRTGDEVTVTFSDETVAAVIMESNDSTFTLVKDNLIMRIDRESGTIRMTRGTRYVNIACTRTIFRM